MVKEVKPRKRFTPRLPRLGALLQRVKHAEEKLVNLGETKKERPASCFSCRSRRRLASTHVLQAGCMFFSQECSPPAHSKSLLHKASHSSMECVVKITARPSMVLLMSFHMQRRDSGSTPVRGKPTKNQRSKGGKPWPVRLFV